MGMVEKEKNSNRHDGLYALRTREFGAERISTDKLRLRRKTLFAIDIMSGSRKHRLMERQTFDNEHIFRVVRSAYKQWEWFHRLSVDSASDTLAQPSEEGECVRINENLKNNQHLISTEMKWDTGDDLEILVSFKEIQLKLETKTIKQDTIYNGLLKYKVIV